MNIFDDYSKLVLETLNKNAVEYLVIGGYAVNYYGYNRTTGDIDLWIKPDNINRDKIIYALKTLYVDETSLQELKNLDFEKHIVFSDGEKPFKIDFMTHVSGVKFDDAWISKQMAEIEGLPIPFINLHHLVISKFNTGRPQDKMDVEELQKIQTIKNKK